MLAPPRGRRRRLWAPIAAPAPGWASELGNALARRSSFKRTAAITSGASKALTRSGVAGSTSPSRRSADAGACATDGKSSSGTRIMARGIRSGFAALLPDKPARYISNWLAPASAPGVGPGEPNVARHHSCAIPKTSQLLPGETLMVVYGAEDGDTSVRVTRPLRFGEPGD